MNRGTHLSDEPEILTYGTKALTNKDLSILYKTEKYRLIENYILFFYL